ncbi:MltA-interacting MipA family protein [Mesorhizobium sp. L-8-10]|uniref:MipA/OmpV family protein n=1 Tax=Mesorhizobium sp. L-8-10 TaxID=2744523 RepID=UPI001937F201|nr:MipA/OmpV family protein [Mesorhizobium sp. L-8-10]BCH34560.1 MltA-interacting MipA family protein [Mesorhizobium sp. L-8-10]
MHLLVVTGSMRSKVKGAAVADAQLFGLQRSAGLFIVSKRLLGRALPGLCLVLSVSCAHAGENWFSGDWYLTVGASGFIAPEYEGARKYLLGVSPLVSLGRAGTETRFSSRNDNISIAFIDTGAVRAGATGKIVFERSTDESDDLAGLQPVEWGAEVGGFAEVYPTHWLRVRGEVRRGIRAHDAIVGDIQVDAFADVTPTVRVSGGPRLSVATSDYFETYYGVDAAGAAATGLSAYDPGAGLESVGVGGAVTWKTTDKITTSLFGEYARLQGPAAASSLVKERGSPNQFLLGLSATYRFDFSL